jgi:hypothetical protein
MFYWTARVTPGALARPATAKSTCTAAPAGAFAGTRALIWITPETNPGAGPA